MQRTESFDTRLEAARDGHPDAWAAIYDSLAPIIHGYLYNQSLDDPDDVAGETFLQIVRDIDRFDGGERQFRSWALTIAHHRMLDARRARGRRPADPTPHEQMPPGATEDHADAPVLERSEWDHIGELLDHLTEDQRGVVVLRVVNELTLDETAWVLDRTVGSVKALQHRAFSALRERLSADRNPIHADGAHRVWPT